MIVPACAAREILEGRSDVIDLFPCAPSSLMLFLSPKAIEFFGDLLDRQWPGVHLYETPLVGAAPKFVRILGEPSPP